MSLSSLWELACNADWAALATLLMPILIPYLTGTLTPVACRKLIGPLLAWIGRTAAAVYQGVAVLLSHPPGPLAQRMLDLLSEHIAWDATGDGGLPSLMRMGDGAGKDVQVFFDGAKVREVNLGLCPVLPQLSRRERKLVSAAALACLRGVTARTMAPPKTTAGSASSVNAPHKGKVA